MTSCTGWNMITVDTVGSSRDNCLYRRRCSECTGVKTVVEQMSVSLGEVCSLKTTQETLHDVEEIFKTLCRREDDIVAYIDAVECLYPAPNPDNIEKCLTSPTKKTLGICDSDVCSSGGVIKVSEDDGTSCVIGSAKQKILPKMTVPSCSSASSVHHGRNTEVLGLPNTGSSGGRLVYHINFCARSFVNYYGFKNTGALTNACKVNRLSQAVEYVSWDRAKDTVCMLQPADRGVTKEHYNVEPCSKAAFKSLKETIQLNGFTIKLTRCLRSVNARPHHYLDRGIICYIDDQFIYWDALHDELCKIPFLHNAATLGILPCARAKGLAFNVVQAVEGETSAEKDGTIPHSSSSRVFYHIDFCLLKLRAPVDLTCEHNDKLIYVKKKTLCILMYPPHFNAPKCKADTFKMLSGTIQDGRGIIKIMNCARFLLSSIITDEEKSGHVVCTQGKDHLIWIPHKLKACKADVHSFPSTYDVKSALPCPQDILNLIPADDISDKPKRQATGQVFIVVKRKKPKVKRDWQDSSTTSNNLRSTLISWIFVLFPLSREVTADITPFLNRSTDGVARSTSKRSIILRHLLQTPNDTSRVKAKFTVVVLSRDVAATDFPNNLARAMKKNADKLDDEGRYKVDAKSIIVKEDILTSRTQVSAGWTERNLYPAVIGCFGTLTILLLSLIIGWRRKRRRMKTKIHKAACNYRGPSCDRHGTTLKKHRRDTTV